VSKLSAILRGSTSSASETVNLSPGSEYRFGLRGSKSGDSLFWAIR
jgi:hypothetical protein